ncbi:MAG: hypothetical protein K8L97_24680 [Anaerolineae bacterium]|nr:hypothetical protein [Anaerolineae bacterium]
MPPMVKDYAPYFRNGRLYLPAHTVTLLTDAGLDKGIGNAALNGLALDDQRDQIALISKALEIALEQLEEDSQEFRALTSPDTKFLLTGKTASV